MITICHPIDDLELLLLRAALEAEGVPHFILGNHFGSLYPGMQVPFYNERSVRVPEAYRELALQIVSELRADYAPVSVDLPVKSKWRMLFEALLMGWTLPGGDKKPK